MAVAAVRISVRSGLPSLLIFLGIGLLLGESGLGITFDSEELTQVLGYSALVLILAEGGLTTRWSGIRRSVAPAAVLSTVGVFVSVGVVAVAARYVLQLEWPVALLIGAILSSTDAAAVFSVLRTVPLPRRLSGMLERSRGSTTRRWSSRRRARRGVGTHGRAPPVVVPPSSSRRRARGRYGHRTDGGLVGAWLLRRVAGASSALFSIGVVSLVVLAYALAATASTSGFIAAYLSALVLGNLGLPHRSAVHSFSSALGSIAQIGLFVLLGLLASPSQLPEQIVAAVVIGLVLPLARPLSVLVSLTPFRIPLRDQAFLSWAGLRGAVPIVLATVPATLGTPKAERIFDLVFVLVIIFTLVQARPCRGWRDGWGCRVGQRGRARRGDHALGDDGRGGPPGDSRRPVPAAWSGDLRAAAPGRGQRDPGSPRRKGFVPQGQTVLRHGDQLLVVSSAEARRKTEERIRAVDEGGRLAGWA